MSDVESLSVVLCTFNRAAALRRTFELLGLLRVPADLGVEFVVVDNNSTDETREICLQFANSAEAPVKYCFEPKPGLSHARNHGVAKASGDVVLFTDDDIDVPVDWLEGYFSTYRRYKADAVFGRITPDWGHGRPDWFHPKLGPIYGFLDYGDLEHVVSSRRQEFFGANFSVRRSLLEAVGEFDTSLGRTPDALYISEERKVFLELINRRCTVVYNPALHVRHRVSDAMKSRSYVKKYYRDTAVSLVNMTPGDTKRALLGVPYYRIIEAVKAVAMFVPRSLRALLLGDSNAVFPLRLEMIRSVRICLLHLQHR